MNTCTFDFFFQNSFLSGVGAKYSTIQPVRTNNGIKFKGVFRDFELISNGKFSNKEKACRTVQRRIKYNTHSSGKKIPKESINLFYK